MIIYYFYFATIIVFNLAAALEESTTSSSIRGSSSAAIDIDILKRKGASEDFSESIVEAANARSSAMSDERRAMLSNNVVCGLPGAAQKCPWTMCASICLLTMLFRLRSCELI